MSQKSKPRIRDIPKTTLRRLRNTPTYFFLIWRWAWWFYALAWIALSLKQPTPLLLFLLGITFIQSLVVTLYAPVFKIFLPGLPWKKKSTAGQDKEQRARRERRTLWRRSRPRPLAADEEPEILPPLARSNNFYRDFAIYGLDVIICGLVMYFSAYISSPPYGNGSPFYRYGFSTIFVAAFAYGYRGSLVAAAGYDLFVLLGVFFPPPMAHPYVFHIHELLGSTLDAPLIAILTAYMAALLNSLTQHKRREQDSVRRQRYLLHVSETLVTATGASDRQRLLQQSVKQIRQGGHFGYLIIAIIAYGGDRKRPQPEIDTYVESGPFEAKTPDESEALVAQVAQSGERMIGFEQLKGEGQEESKGIARLYLPFKKEEQVHMVLGAASERHTPFEEKQENFLKIVGSLLVVALENMHLTEQAADLAAAGERGRIAREIHDGIAQLIYMLSLNSETCAALLQRIADASEEDAQALAPVAERLDKMVTISKQALWETRHYIFTLKPLMSGSTTLTQMLTNQLREFEAISGLPAHLEVEGVEASPNGDQRRVRKTAQVGTAIFRITQEALTNAYKHAGATQVQVRLHHLAQCIEVEINDDGKGVYALPHSYDPGADGEKQRIYSGHGMRGMRERAEELGGTFEVMGGPTGGTSIMARIPI